MLNPTEKKGPAIAEGIDAQSPPSIKRSRIIAPVVLGVGAIIYLFIEQFDPAEFSGVRLDSRIIFWLGISILLAAVRHLALAARLRVLTNNQFSWWKCIEIIFIWEFAAAVSPTAMGGSIAAFFIMGNEKLPLAKSTTIVLYTILLDGIFQFTTIPLFFFLIGPAIISPGAEHVGDMDAWGFYLALAYLAMLIYIGLIAFGLFIGPQSMKNFLSRLTRFTLFQRFHSRALQLGDDLVIASKNLRDEPKKFHTLAHFHSVVAWSAKFGILSAIIIAFVPALPLEFWIQLELYARLEVTYFVIAFSPTPGGAGLIELLFSSVLADYATTASHSTVISAVWRIITFYFFLAAGAIIVPHWINEKLYNRRKSKALPTVSIPVDDARP